MIKYSRTLSAALCLVSFAIYAGPVAAQPVATAVTFSGPVQLPGVVLPAGSYQFSRARDGRSVVVFDANHRAVTTLVVIPITRAKRGEVVTMRPSVGGAPPEVSALYSGGGTAGFEFVHRSAQK